MKYITDTLKYIKSNPMLWVGFGVAFVCFLTLTDTSAIHNVLGSYEGGVFNAEISDWICLFLPFNTSSWWMILISLAGYVVLILNLALLCASTDRHMRYNSLSPRGIWSSLNNCLLPCTTIMLILFALSCVNSVILAGIMMATSFSSVKYMFILGITICTLLFFAEFYFLTFFALWLPCFNITGFRAYESLTYAYSLGATKRISMFLAIFVPTAVFVLCGLPFIFVNIPALSAIVLSLFSAALFVYISALIYVIYLDADGITREDLKKF